jgi:hypothetical protein
MNNLTKEWKNWFHRRSITHFTSTLSGMAGRFAVPEIPNALNVLLLSSVITAAPNFDSDLVYFRLSKKRSKNDLLCTILFQDCGARPQ